MIDITDSELKEYVTYVVRYKGEVVYVGEGKKGREKHCKSGMSQVYGLNKLHFSLLHDDNDITVRIEFTSDSKEDVYKCENDLIKKYVPWFNRKLSDGLSYKTFLKTGLDVIYYRYLVNNKKDTLSKQFIESTEFILKEGLCRGFFGISNRSGIFIGRSDRSSRIFAEMFADVFYKDEDGVTKIKHDFVVNSMRHYEVNRELVKQLKEDFNNKCKQRRQLVHDSQLDS